MAHGYVCVVCCVQVCVYTWRRLAHTLVAFGVLHSSSEGMLLAPLPLPSAKLPYYRVTSPLTQLPLTLFTLESSDIVTYKSAECSGNLATWLSRIVKKKMI